MRLYRIPFSTNVERVALALAHKGLEVEPVDVDPNDRSPIVAVSGQSLVPVLEDEGRVVFRYVAGATHGPAGFEANPNGSRHDIAGITNEAGNVVGLMPHPEHAVEDLVGAPGTDGLGFFTSILKKLVNA